MTFDEELQFAIRIAARGEQEILLEYLRGASIVISSLRTRILELESQLASAEAMRQER